MYKVQSLLLIELFLPSLILQISAKLLYVSEIFRNGASEPLSPFLYFKDSPLEGKENPRSFGNLTQFGEEQQFLLGVALQKKYYHNYNFLPPEFEQEIIEIYSDSSERAVRSACSHVLGLFSEKKFTYLPNSTLPHLSLPPFSPYYDDFLRSDPTGVFIKRVREYGNYHRILNHIHQVIPITNFCDFAQTIKQQFKKQHKYIQIMLEEPLFHIKQQLLQVIDSIYDTPEELSLEDLLNFIETQKGSGQKIPDELNTLFSNITFAHEVTTLIYQTNNENLSYLREILPFLRNTLEKFNMAMMNQTNLKWTSYSAQDTSKIVLLLNALNLTSWKCPFIKNKDILTVNFDTTGIQCEQLPTFASSLQIELHEQEQFKIFDSTDTQDSNLKIAEHQEEKYFIRVRYNGQYKFIFGLQSVDCGYEEFKRRIQNYFPFGLESECK